MVPQQDNDTDEIDDGVEGTDGSAGDAGPARGSSSRKVARIGRFGIGVNVAIQLVLIVVLFGAVNYLGYKYHKRWDLTQNRSHSLSDRSLKFLKTLRQDIHIIAAFNPRSQVRYDVTILLEEYADNSKGRVTFEAFDFVKNPDRSIAYADQYNVQFEEDTLIIVAGDEVRYIRGPELILMDTSPGNEDRVASFLGEKVITSRLLEATEGRKRKIYFIAGHQRAHAATHDIPQFLMLNDIVSSQNAELIPISLLNVTEIPEDADAVVLAAFDEDIDREEFRMLFEYWNKKNGDFLILLNPDKFDNTKNLRQFIDGYGVSARDDRILLASEGAVSTVDYSPPVLFTLHDPPAAVTRDLLGPSFKLKGQTQSLYAPDDDALAADNIQVLPLIEVDWQSNYYGEVDYKKRAPRFKKGYDHELPLNVAVAIEKGGTRDEQLGLDSARMVVVGNCDFLTPNNADKLMTEFVTASLNWMMDREELIGIGPSEPTRYRLNIAEKEYSALLWTITVFMPIGVLFIGVLIWRVRRS